MELEEDKTPKKKSPEWLVPNYPPLKCEDNVGQAAIEGQIHFYPKVVRTMTDPPLTGQRFSCLSFMFFKEPRKLSNGLPVYGYVKSRGNWADESQARFESAKIIREIDSKYQIRIAQTGVWYPLTDEQAFIQDHVDVRMNKEEVHLRDEAVKEKIAEQNRIKRELREREEELKQEGDIYDDPTSLTYYSMRRVTEKTLMESMERQIKQLENTKNVILKVQKELKKLEMEHPEYTDEWVERYNMERRKGGVPDYVPSEEHEEKHALAMKEITLDKEEEKTLKIKKEEE